MIKNNGWISRSVHPSRGIRQGCPISALLFILVVEIMAVKIRAHDDIKGFKIDEKSKVLKLKQYVDYSTLILDNIQDLEKALTCVHDFSNIAGPKLNTTKCDGILLSAVARTYLRGGYNFNFKL